MAGPSLGCRICGSLFQPMRQASSRSSGGSSSGSGGSQWLAVQSNGHSNITPTPRSRYQHLGHPMAHHQSLVCLHGNNRKLEGVRVMPAECQVLMGAAALLCTHPAHSCCAMRHACSLPVLPLEYSKPRSSHQQAERAHRLDGVLPFGIRFGKVLQLMRYEHEGHGPYQTHPTSI